jgi:hypothetical protein
MVAGIDDWHLDRAHRYELAPGYSANDEIPDPFVLGEVPDREWVVPRRKATRSSRRSGRAVPADPKRQQAAQVAPRPAANARRQPSASSGWGRIADWKRFALRWLCANPGGSNRELRAAVEEAGFLPLVKAEISAVRAQANSTRKAARPTAKPRTRRAVPAPSRPDYAPPVRYCDGCGLAVTSDGRCRC